MPSLANTELRRLISIPLQSIPALRRLRCLYGDDTLCVPMVGCEDVVPVLGLFKQRRRRSFAEHPECGTAGVFPPFCCSF